MQTSLEENLGPETKPDLEKTAQLFEGPLGIRSIALTALFILACFYTLYFARAFLLPILLATVFMFLLSPIVRALKKIRIPEYLGAALVILGLFACIGAAVYQLSGPVSDWLPRVSEIGDKLSTELRHITKRVEQVSKAGERIQQAATLVPDTGQKPPQRVEIKQPGLLDGLFSWTWAFAFTLTVVTILLYFLLASGDLFLRKLIHVLPTFADKKKAVHIARAIEDSISRYLLTVAMINAALGTSGALAFWALGMPSPALWGAMGFLLNFIPFLGALTLIVIVGLVATATFASTGHALLVPAVYLALATIEGNFITPWIIGRRMTLNPVVIFLGLTFWGWLWGIPGALLAVPMLVVFKIFCDHIEPLAPVGEFLGS